MNRREDHIQRIIVTHIRKTYDVKVVHVPNGGRRGKIEAVAFKAMGVEAGHPDLVIYAPGGRVYLMEVKAEDGRLSIAQKAFIRDLQAMMFDCAIVYSADEGRRACEAWGLPLKTTRERSAAEMGTGF